MSSGQLQWHKHYFRHFRLFFCVQTVSETHFSLAFNEMEICEFGDGPPGFRGAEAKRGGLGYQRKEQKESSAATWCAPKGLPHREVRHRDDIMFWFQRGFLPFVWNERAQHREYIHTPQATPLRQY